MNKIIHGDSLIELKTLADNSVDSIVTDPPYELGFMGKSWDNTGIANNVELWKECLRVLKPGGHLLSFGGTRTYHRMAVAIEDAGFEVRDMIEWVYGSGFPKSHNIGKAVDKLQGNEREVTGKGKPMSSLGTMHDDNWVSNSEYNETKGTSEWEGWGTALKPAHEPICMARKTLGEKTVAKNVLKWGTGGINIDESRVDYTSEYDKKHQDDIQKGQLNADNGKFFGGSGQSISSGNLQGRFPANLIHDNSEEVRECFPNESERFFKSIIYQAKASKSERNKGCEGLEEKQKAGAEFRPNHQEKANNGETGNPFGRWNKVVNNHPTVKPITLMEYLIKMVTPKGGIVLDPFAGSGTTLVSAKQNGFQYIGIEMTEEYLPIIQARLSAVDK